MYVLNSCFKGSDHVTSFSRQIGTASAVVATVEINNTLSMFKYSLLSKTPDGQSKDVMPIYSFNL
jgi:hypothetical protein